MDAPVFQRAANGVPYRVVSQGVSQGVRPRVVAAKNDLLVDNTLELGVEPTRVEKFKTASTAAKGVSDEGTKKLATQIEALAKLLPGMDFHEARAEDQFCIRIGVVAVLICQIVASIGIFVMWSKVGAFDTAVTNIKSLQRDLAYVQNNVTQIRADLGPVGPGEDGVHQNEPTIWQMLITIDSSTNGGIG